jgi:hypothetical protein
MHGVVINAPLISLRWIIPPARADRQIGVGWFRVFQPGGAAQIGRICAPRLITAEEAMAIQAAPRAFSQDGLRHLL